MLWCIGSEDFFYFVRGSAFDEGLGGALGCLRCVVSYPTSSYHFLGGAGRCCCLVFGGEGVGVLRVAVVDFVCFGGGEGWLFFHFVVLGFGVWI